MKNYTINEASEILKFPPKLLFKFLKDIHAIAQKYTGEYFVCCSPYNGYPPLLRRGKQ